MKIYLAGCSPFVKLIRGAFINDFSEYLQGYDKNYKAEKFYALESFFYVKKGNQFMDYLPQFKGFLLDSGAFTFRQNVGVKANWNQYVEEYADFINHYKIELFFELDVDTEIGYENVLILRNKLEKLTNRQCIPVWHKNRGKEDFIKMCKSYPYVAIGGLVGSINNNTSIKKHLPWFISTAHSCGAKIHGLGFTSLERLKEYHFDSVDSTSWVSGNRFGKVYKFMDGKMLIYDRKANQRIKTKLTAINNFVEWTKFGKWAETHL